MIDDILDQKYLSQFKIVDWGYTEESRPLTYAHYDKWVTENHHGSLSYLSDHRKDLRQDIREYYPEFQSSLVFLFSYAQAKSILNNINQEGTPKIASYTMGFEGHDYHHFISDALNEIFNKLKESYPELEMKIAIDMHPVLDRDLAYRSGLGWFGKNSMLISRKHGSYFLIGSLILNQKFPLSSAKVDTDHCGNCHACVSACPTDAINGETRSVVADQCISTFTIEKFRPEEPPQGYHEKLDEFFGCDICQEVCPWNNKQMKLHEMASMDDLSDKAKELVNFFSQAKRTNLFEKISSMSNGEYRRFFKGTSFARSGKRGLLKNLLPFLED